MQLGNFSVSLAVKDIHASKAFIRKAGLRGLPRRHRSKLVDHEEFGCRDRSVSGMFEKNILTFNPGWDRDANTLESYADIRQLQNS